MKQIFLAAALLCAAAPAYAQFGGLGGAIKKAGEAKQKVDDLTVSEAEERQIGEDVSEKIRARYGVVQDPAVHKYVTLVGTTLAKQSERPNLNWMFVVLDTDAVNAFASPGGIVHVTRGALALANNEAELAGILGHEIGHVAHKHTVNAIQKSKAVQMGSDAAGGRAAFLDQIANRAYSMIIENSFDRGDELDADKVGVTLAQKSGYAANALGEFLTRLDARNSSQTTKNGMFASHPATKERVDKIKQQSAGANAPVVVEARYKANIKYQPTPMTSIATVTEGSAGLAGGKEEPKKPEAKEEPKKKGFGLGGLKQAVAPEKQSTQVSASGGARGLEPDKDAKGGANPNLVRVSVSAAELDAFKKSIA
jgi:predicted Zn-dependent protease